MSGLMVLQRQITSIRPNYRSEGRSYNVSALSYEPLFVTGSEVIISGNKNDINLYNDYAGAPSGVVELTFIFDGASIGSNGNLIPAIRAGAFAAGSKIIIILANGADLQAAGGGGGKGGGGTYEFEDSAWNEVFPTDGKKGGIVYDAEGIETDIYFAGATPSAAYPTADGYLRAPSGGDGGFSASLGVGPNSGVAGDGGNGGNGRASGAGGAGGSVVGATVSNTGATGDYGDSSPPLGISGANNNAIGGAAGSGVKDSGAAVTFYGDDSTRYINGNGDHV